MKRKEVQIPLINFATPILLRGNNLIHTYNETKGGTDTFDQLCHSYTTARETRRWPLRIFFNILDAGAKNAMVLFSLSNPQWREGPKNNRGEFIKKLGMALITPHLQERLLVQTLQKPLRSRIAEILSTEVPQRDNVEVNLTKKVRCSLCVRGKDRKTSFACALCRKPYCLEHRAKLCTDYENQN
ncbi:Transposase IS4 [Popillia japonica]|uniref:Transposase IS4 n=1 Tax=Popillia japonica TaxID=7064 RepID=A0AAW1IES2_POPJA